jgi:hypothetical protein
VRARIVTPEQFLAKLEHVRSAGENRWMARCPAHPDDRSSLSIRATAERLLLNCFARCSADEITGAVGCTLGDLFLNGNGHHPPAERRIVATYDYTDGAGEIVFQVVRFAPKNFVQRRPDPVGGWIWNLEGINRPLYRLPDLAEQTRAIWTEGEKDADRLASLQLVATTAAGGVAGWRSAYAEQLAVLGVREVIILPDHDGPGEQYALTVARGCRAQGLGVRIVRLPGLPSKGDVSDWFDAGHTPEDLEQLIAGTPLVTDAELTVVPGWGPSPAETGSPVPGSTMREPAGVADGPVLVRLDTVAPEAVSWLWPGRIARGKLTLVIGEPGDGKSTLTLDVGSRVTRGLGWPDGGAAPTGSVGLLAAEDALADTVRPRVDRQGGDPTKIFVLRAVRRDGAEAMFSIERDLPALEAALRETQAILLIIDPLSAYLGARDSHKDTEIRGLLTPLVALAERYDCAIIGVLHLTKSATRKLLLRAQGSIAFVAQARIVLAVGTDPESAGRRLMVPIKNNLGAFAPALAFTITDAGLQWAPGTVEGVAEDLLAGDEPGSRTDRKERDDARRFLQDALADGPVASKELYQDAKANGIAARTLERAKTELGIQAARQGRGPWYWMLPHREPAP